MLTLFQNITEELTPLERDTLVPMLIDTLHGTHEGHVMKGKDICAWFSVCTPAYHVAEPRLRKMVNYIRVMKVKQGLHRSIEGHVVIGAATGYYLTTNAATVQEQIDSLQGRCNSMYAVIDSLKDELQQLQKRKP